MKRVETDEDRKRRQEDRKRKAEGLSKGELFLRYERVYEIIKRARIYWFRHAVRYRAVSAVYAAAFEELSGMSIDYWFADGEFEARVEKQRRVERDGILAVCGSYDGPGRGRPPTDEKVQ